MDVISEMSVFPHWPEKLKSFDVQTLLIFLVALLTGKVLYSRMKKRSKNLAPGPMGLPVFGYLPFLGREPHKTMKKLSKRYGNIFGLYMGSKYTVVLNEYKLMKETLSNSGALDRAKNIFDHLVHSGFASFNGEEWQEQRKFSISAARDLGFGKGSWESLMMEEVWSFIKEMESHKGSPTDINGALNASVSSNIISLLIGRRLDKVTEKDKIRLCVDYAEKALMYVGPSDPVTVMPGLRKGLLFFRVGGYYKACRIIEQFSQFVADEINRHKDTPILRNVPDFINLYLDKLGNMTTNAKSTSKHYFSEHNLQGNLSILFLGASDTVSSSIGWAMRLMAEHQDVQEKVYKELDEILDQNSYPTYQERHKIPYTFAVLMEILRFSSNVPLSTTRCASRDMIINGYTIPKGTEIVANLWAIHNDPDYWDEPEKFKPERYLNEDATEIAKQVPSFCPFSVGRRGCPGETFAWMEMLAYFSEIIRKFHISAPAGLHPEFEEINALVSRLKPQPLCFVPRSKI